MISFKIQNLDDENDHMQLHKGISWISHNTVGKIQIFTDSDWVKTKTYWVTFEESQEGMIFKLTWSDRLLITASSSPE